jgi:hypothetical protein
MRSSWLLPVGLDQRAWELPINPNDIPCVSIWSTRASFDRKIVSAKNSKRLSVQLTHLVKLRADDMPRVRCIYVLLEYESNGKEG